MSRYDTIIGRAQAQQRHAQYVTLIPVYDTLHLAPKPEIPATVIVDDEVITLHELMERCDALQQG